MKNNSNNNENEDFSSLFSDIKPLKHDKVFVAQQSTAEKKQKLEQNKARMASKRANADFEFSDQYEAHFDSNKALSFARDNADNIKVKALRRGLMVPDIRLDLHGLTRQQTKLEISALLHEAYEQHVECVNIIHGVSGGVLKQQVPSWLVQHPKVIGFHQAPLEWGGNGALLVLIQTRLNDKSV